MKKYRLIIQPPAFDDLDEAYQWILERSPEAAARWFNGFVDALNSLTQSPERCGLAPENDTVEPEIRQLLYGRRGGVYRALFTIMGNPRRLNWNRRSAGMRHQRHMAAPTAAARPKPIAQSTHGVGYQRRTIHPRVATMSEPATQAAAAVAKTDPRNTRRFIPLPRSASLHGTHEAL